MKHKLLIAAAAAALMSAPTLASAQDSGVYLKAQAGYGVVGDVDIDPTNSQFNGINGDAAGQGNLALGLGLGYDFGNNWRIELDGSSIYNDLGTIGGQPATKATIQANSLMLNLLYDFSDFGRWEPYVGAGVGLTQGNFSLAASDFLNDTGTVLVANPACASAPVAANTARACAVDDSDTNFSWNLIAGLGYNITDNLTWDTNYRYVDMGDFNLDGEYTQQTTPAGVPITAGLQASVQDVSTHMLMTGFRYRFGKSAPVVVPVVPAPPVTYTCWDGSTEVTNLNLCPVQTFTCWDGATEVTDLDLCPAQVTYYTCGDGVTSVTDLAACPVITCQEQFRQELIYYEFDKGQSAETRNTINRILDVGQYCNISSVRVVGHTDTSGAAAYNLGLSQRRASDAQEELVRQGVSGAMISSEGKGETEPFVQTGNGVREQLNRRTEVLITLSDVGTAMMSN
ncbi:MAG: OmpA family protein [Litorimonas sp.]